ncbi:DUF885 family protein [Gemmatimonas sp.]|uniref:DUF885 family protein n=1 Tax=Gemmatimonas sp. TaxID=1962908 RepID=UPI003982F676
MNATFTGLHTHDHRLPDWSRDARDAEVSELAELHDALFNAAPRGNDALLAADIEAVDAELARANIDLRILETQSRFFHDRNPALWTGEAIFSVVALLLRPTPPIERCTDALIARLGHIRSFLGAMPDALTEPVPAIWIDRATREARVFAAFLRGPLQIWCDEHELTAAVRDPLIEAATDAARAFDAATDWLSQLPRDVHAGYAIGVEAYEILLQRGHFCTQSAQQLLQRALDELPAAKARFHSLATDVAGSPESLGAALANDRPDETGYLAAFTLQFEACRSFALSHDLVEWPDWPLRYSPIPAWAREIAPQLYFLFYRSPAPYDPRPEHMYLVTPVDDTIAPDERDRRLKAWNRSTITLNHVVHHGALGHHVQNGHATHRSQSRIGSVAAVDCASRIGMFLGGSMAEGWACYATELADELGFLTPLERAAEQQSRVRMLARAIVDIRLHTGDFRYADAVAYYMHEVGMPEAAAVGEATKNSMFPCTAVMYWLGTQGILDLRETMRQRSDYSPRQFHDALLSRGSIPVALAARLLTATS